MSSLQYLIIALALCAAAQFSLVFLSCYSCTFFKLMFYVLIESFWKALTALKGKERVFVWLNHSFNFTLKTGWTVTWHFWVRKYFPHFVILFFFLTLLKGCQGDKLPVVYIVQDTYFEDARREVCWQPLCTWCYMTVAVYVQLCEHCNNSSQGRVTSYPALREFVLHL